MAEAENDAKEEKELPEGAEGESAEDEGGGGKKKKKLIIIVAAVVLLLVLGGAGAFFMGMFGGGEEKADEHAAADGHSEEEASGAPVYFDIPQMLVNLNTGGKQVSFIKATITLELQKPGDVALVQTNLPRLLDNYNTFLREMRASDLYGSAGIYRLREEMLARANKILAPVKVRDVLFREILVQ